MRARSCLRLHLVGLRRGDLRVERRALARRLLDHRLRLAVRAGAARRRARRGEIRLGLREAHLVLGRIDRARAPSRPSRDRCRSTFTACT